MSTETYDKLTNEYRWYGRTAEAFIEAKGYCIYCRADLLSSRTAYLASIREHLLPTNKYPDEEDNPLNNVLACSSCNSMKGQFDPLTHIGTNITPSEALEKKRSELIKLVKDHLNEKIEIKEEEWKAIYNIFRDNKNI